MEHSLTTSLLEEKFLNLHILTKCFFLPQPSFFRFFLLTLFTISNQYEAKLFLYYQKVQMLEHVNLCDIDCFTVALEPHRTYFHHFQQTNA